MLILLKDAFKHKNNTLTDAFYVFIILYVVTFDCIPPIIYSMCVLVLSVCCINYVDDCLSQFICECAECPYTEETMTHNQLLNECI